MYSQSDLSTADWLLSVDLKVLIKWPFVLSFIEYKFEILNVKYELSFVNV